MSEDLIIKHCSPTLAGLKTANLFSCVYTDKAELKRYAERFNERFGAWGVKMQPLEFGRERALIYVYRPTKLKATPHNSRRTVCLNIIPSACPKNLGKASALP